MRKLLLLLMIPTLFSCEKKDKPITPIAPPGVEENAVEMGNFYERQIFFDLGTNTEVKNSDKMAWDLAFETTSEGKLIRLNSSRRMVASKTSISDFTQVTSANQAKQWKWDHANGSPELTAIGQWWDTNGNSLNEVYLIDLGYDSEGNLLGYRKLQIVEATSAYFRIRFARLNGSDEQTVDVIKEGEKNHTCYSLINKTMVDFEPETEAWDLLFTNYTETLWDGTDSIFYLVTGVLINLKGVEVAFTKSISFDDLSLENLPELAFSSAQNAIGYEWKYLDFNTLIYTVEPDFLYVIKDMDGEFFKFKFIGFYNDIGEKGAPAFRFQRL
jgi:hypothetical protein